MEFTHDEPLIEESPISKKKNIAMDSQLMTTMMGCHRLFDFRFNHDLVSIHGKPKSFEMGSIVHTYLEFYHKAIIQGRFKSVAHEEGMKKAEEYAYSEEVKNTEPEDRQWALKTCELYHEFYKNEHWIPLFVEHVKSKILYEDENIRVLYKAKFDLITDTNQGIYPVDHKTMSQRRDTLSLNNQFMGQCLVEGTRGMFVNKIGFQKTLKPQEKFERKLIPYSAARLNEHQLVTIPTIAYEILKAHESGHWGPNYTHCETKYGFCQFRAVCESEPNMRDEELRNSFIKGSPWDVSND